MPVDIGRDWILGQSKRDNVPRPPDRPPRLLHLAPREGIVPISLLAMVVAFYGVWFQVPVRVSIFTYGTDLAWGAFGRDQIVEPVEQTGPYILIEKANSCRLFVHHFAPSKKSVQVVKFAPHLTVSSLKRASC